jgi:hypothetical protein
VNAEVTEAANSTLTQELAEARATITRLSTHHARSVGWDTRLRAAIQDKDDLQQERDSESQRARAAEQRLGTLKDKCCEYLHGSTSLAPLKVIFCAAKLQTEVQKLEKDLQHQRQHRLELSEEILKDARSRLEMLQHSQLGHSAPADETEITKILETLVADNEDLKRNNAELQNLLGESREDVHALNEELDELRAAAAAKPPPRLFLLQFRIAYHSNRAITAERSNYRHKYTNSASSVFSDLSTGLASTMAMGTAVAGAPLTPRSIGTHHPGASRLGIVSATAL